MRLIFLLTIIFLSSCENKKDTMVNRQQAIKKEMDHVKAFYYKKSDSLESVKKADTNSAKHHVIAEELVSAERTKNVMLIPLQKEYDSLEVELKK
jgi:PBP1b-binding outer membrane lipoprotein LpoB